MTDNVEIARLAMDVFLRRSLEEAYRLSAPDIELTTLFDEPGTVGFTGHDGLRLWFERLDDLWAFIEVRELELSEHQDGWVLIRAHARARGRGSPDEFEPQVAAAIKVVDGKVAKAGLYPRESDALAAIESG